MCSLIEASLPNEIIIGPFSVNVRPLREFLASKCIDISHQLLSTYADSLHQELHELLFEYTRITQRLDEQPNNIEQVQELREWMEGVPFIVKGHDEIMQKLKINFDLLEYFFYNLSDEDSAVKWQTIGYPQLIQRQVSFSSFFFIIIL